MRYAVRPFQPDDAAAVDDILRQAFAGFEDDFAGAGEALAAGPARLAATGHRLLVAMEHDRPVGVVRWWWDEEGIAWFDLLASGIAGAGRSLVREVERTVQQRGLRWLRVRIPAEPILEEYFARAGYLPVGGGNDDLLLQKRLPLLTVREQRREDAASIAALTGADPWPFEQGARPGWFVLADGERVTGAIAVRESTRGAAAVHVLELDGDYRGRGIETWMLERAAAWAETNGFLEVTVPAAFVPRALERDLEDRGWFSEDESYVRRARDAWREPSDDAWFPR